LIGTSAIISAARRGSGALADGSLARRMLQRQVKHESGKPKLKKIVQKKERGP
jgi:hypothetical protein